MSAIDAASRKRTDGKTRLLDAARSLFSRGGFDDTSVSNILSVSGLKAPSLYHHFQDKEGLYTVWATTVLDEAGCRIKEAAPQDLATLAKAITEGSAFDYLQVKRDLRSIQNPQNLHQIETAIQKNLTDPVLDLLTKLERTPLSSTLFLHMAMVFHPAYSEGSSDTPPDFGLTSQAWDRLFVRAE